MNGQTPTSLGELLKVCGGSLKTGPFGTALKAAEYSKLGGVPIISVGEIGYGTLRVGKSTPQVGDDVLRRLPEYRLRTGDIVFGRKGAVDRCALVREREGGYFLGSDGIRLRPGTGIDSEFLAYQFQSSRVRNWLIRNSSGTTMASLNQEILGRVPVNLPTLPEQRRAAEALNAADGLIAALERLIAKKQAIKLGMMQQVFALPEEEHHRAELATLVSMLSGGTPNRSIGDYWSGTIPWISATTLKALEVASSDQAVTEKAVRVGSKMAPLHSTLVLVRGSALHSEIRASLVTAPVCFNQDVKALVPTARLEPKFLTYSIHANASRLLSLVTSAGNTAGVLDTKVLKNFEIWLPSCERQRTVVSIFDDVTSEIDALSIRLAKARAIKTGMMQQLLTGRTQLPMEASS